MSIKLVLIFRELLCSKYQPCECNYYIVFENIWWESVETYFWICKRSLHWIITWCQACKSRLNEWWSLNCSECLQIDQMALKTVTQFLLGLWPYFQPLRYTFFMVQNMLYKITEIYCPRKRNYKNVKIMNCFKKETENSSSICEFKFFSSKWNQRSPHLTFYYLFIL